LHSSSTPCSPSANLATLGNSISAAASQMLTISPVIVSICGSVQLLGPTLKNCLSTLLTAMVTNSCSSLLHSWIAPISFPSGNPNWISPFKIKP
jgi:hypothetical protein